MRYSIATVALFVAYAGVEPAHAATSQAGFSVGAIVVASCTLVPGKPPTVPGGSVCLAQAFPSTVAAPQPIVRITRDEANGRKTVLVEF